MPEQLVGTVDELGPGSVRGIGDWAVLNVNGERYAVSRRCRHLRAMRRLLLSPGTGRRSAVAVLRRAEQPRTHECINPFRRDGPSSFAGDDARASLRPPAAQQGTPLSRRSAHH